MLETSATKNVGADGLLSRVRLPAPTLAGF